MRYSIYLAIPLMLGLAVIQTAVLPHFTILGMSPHLPFLVALTWGLLHTRDEGLIWGFIAGLCMDIFSISPFGLTALTYLVAIMVALIVNDAFPVSRVLMPALMAGLATIIAFILNLLILRIIGVIYNFHALSFLPTLVLLNAITILPIYWLIYFLESKFRPKQIHL